MITSWNIYLVMQLDSISRALTFITCLSLIAVVVSIIWNSVSKSDADQFPSISDRPKLQVQWVSRDKWRKRILAFALPLFFINMLIPSSKTAAAMIVIPAIANNERLQAEATDLYDLAKQGLKRLVAPEEESTDSE